MLRPSFLALVLAIGALGNPAVYAQSHFTTCNNGAGNVFNATVIVPVESTPAINGVPLSVGSEIAVFSSDVPTLCVGKFTWHGNHASLTVWGDDHMMPANDGLMPGEEMQYRVWHSATGIEYSGESVSVSYTQSEGTYGDDAVLVLSDLDISIAPSEPVLVAPSDGATGVSIDPLLTWNASASAVTYHVQVATDTSFATLAVDESGLTSTSYQVTALAYATPYFWRVRATNAEGDSPWATPYTFTTIQTPLDQPPTVTITAPANGSSFNLDDPISFTGTALDPEDSDISASLSWSSSLDGNLGNGASFTCPGPSCSALSGGTHIITAFVADSGGNTDTDQISVTVIAPATDVHIASILTEAINVGQGNKVGRATVQVQDDQGNPAVGYVLNGFFSGDIIEAASDTTDGSGIAVLQTVGTAHGGVTLSFCVGIVDGDLPYDPTDNADPSFGCGGGIPPTGLTATAVSNSEIDLAWTDNTSDESGFKIERSLNETTFSQIATVGANVTNYPDPGLTASTTYYYRVRAFNGNGNSGYSNTASATTSASGAAISVHVQNIQTGQQNIGQGNKRGTATVTILNDLGGPVAGYTVTGNFSGDFNETGAFGVTDGSGVVTLLTDGFKKGQVNVGFCVTDVAGGLPYDPGDNASGAFDCGLPKRGVTAAGETPNSYALEQNFPNPFNPSTVVAYSLAEAGPVTLRVFNVLGQEVATLVDGYETSGRHEVVFDASHLSAGVYLYVMETGGFTTTRRMTLLK